MNGPLFSREKPRNVGAVILVLGSIVVAAIVVALNYQAQGKATGGDLCRISGPTGVMAIAIDATDTLSAVQQLHVRNLLGIAIEAMPANWRLEIWDVSPVAGIAGPIGSAMCKPETDVSSVTGNPAKAKQMRKEFDDRINALLAQAMTSSSSSKSPIIEALQAIGLKTFGDPRLPPSIGRRLVLVSDLIQNTEKLTFLHGLVPYGAFKASDEFNIIRPPITDAEVQILFLSRPGPSELTANALIEWWQELLADCRARLTSVEHVVG